MLPVQGEWWPGRQMSVTGVVGAARRGTRSRKGTVRRKGANEDVIAFVLVMSTNRDAQRHWRKSRVEQQQ